MARRKSWSLLKWLKLLLNMVWKKPTRSRLLDDYGTLRRNMRRGNSINDLLKICRYNKSNEYRSNMHMFKNKDKYPLRAMRNLYGANKSRSYQRCTMSRPVAKLLLNRGVQRRKRKNAMMRHNQQRQGSLTCTHPTRSCLHRMNASRPNFSSTKHVSSRPDFSSAKHTKGLMKRNLNCSTRLNRSLIPCKQSVGNGLHRRPFITKNFLNRIPTNNINSTMQVTRKRRK